MTRLGFVPAAAAAGVTDHGALSGLADPDHGIGSVSGLADALAAAGSTPVSVGPVALGAHGGGEAAYTWVEVPDVAERGLAWWVEVTSSDAANLFDVQVRSAGAGGGTLSLEAIGVTDQTYLVTAPVYLSGSVAGSIFVGIKNRHAEPVTFTLTLLNVERFA